MSDTPSKPDWRHTVFLPKTDFPMKAGLPQKEPAILAKWEADGVYNQVRAAREGREKFILHDGPPYANGDIHIGHALNHILKDMVVRTQTLLGKDAPYVPGWDCHGLPIEWKVEEQYRKKKLNKDEVPVREFRAECRAYAQNWVDVQREQLKRLGIGGRWDKPYLTMNFEAEGTIVAELMKFAESGQLYRGAKPVMWSPVEKTALAEAEIEYEDIVSTQIDVAFEIVESPIPELVGAHAVIWTTTPWTIPVNQAIAYGPDIEYLLVHITELDGSKRRYLVAEPLMPDFLLRLNLMERANSGQIEQFDVSGADFVGRDLAGTIARHPMAKLFESPLPFRGGAGGGACSSGATSSDTPHPNPSPEGEGLNIDPHSPLAQFFLKPRPFLPGEFVTTDTGTGLVHMAPDHGEDDFDLCKAHGIDPVFAVEADGKYRENWAWLGGQGSVINNKFNAPDGPICSDLRNAGALLAASDFKHSYPHSWRSKAKVIYRCTPQWFIAMDRPLSPLPFRGGAGGGACPTNAVLIDNPHPNPSPEGEGLSTLRELATQAIADTRFVPDKGRNRIGSMVEGRPDWVISRQRAWGVPIALFVERGTNQPLVDAEVNHRIVSTIKAHGVDAWSAENAASFLGPNRDPADYERVTDILDVWFDSGCTHAFTLESGTWLELSWPADLYLEGSDQHRGWFQSSLLESCGTRGRAPYKAVLTHGFTMDSKGMKMSKSLGNTISPLDLMKEHGADMLRLWALSVDFTEDHRIGKEILSGVADQYRKLRNTFRYLLGALEGFSEAEKVAVDEMPELERYILALLADLDAKLRQAVQDYDFNAYTRLLAEFANNDLSAFYFDIRKDCLYCDAPSDPKRRAYRTVLDQLFHALVRWCAPVLVFTAEEVWATRYPDGGSVHLLEWLEIGNWQEPGLTERYQELRTVRALVFSGLENARRDKTIGSSLEARVFFELMNERHAVAAAAWSNEDWQEFLIVSEANAADNIQAMGGTGIGATMGRTDNHKCGRCWRHLPEVEEDGDLCDRCEHVVHG